MLVISVIRVFKFTTSAFIAPESIFEHLVVVNNCVGDELLRVGTTSVGFDFGTVVPLPDLLVGLGISTGFGTAPIPLPLHVVPKLFSEQV